MIFSEISFHDSQIQKVTENPNGQTIEFLLDFPTDWKNNIYENKVLRFEDVTFYSVEEIPFGSLPTILNIIDLGEINKDLSTEKNKWIVTRHKIKIETTAGTRTIEFSNCEFM
ncbi:hypothetical protein FCR2A7T_07020 [Flavobacterium cauense R2A-7]|uniref:hypothetical protein n=1 Tax=Flavobacterium cauense TaxID=510946 RepID=UPI0003C580B0|nr:hypothetical protein [Flavobacterium cauense]ESU21149.1 hypothetical protein FCR2A7T_07020 [Flavobacterium cauense R2A-7]KGO78692.1 hypothetical protein Q762_15000 [Flavobacterium cauense R2A-7]